MFVFLCGPAINWAFTPAGLAPADCHAATEDGWMDIFVLVSELLCVPGSAKPGPEHLCTSSEPPVHPQRHDRVGAKQAAGLLHMCLPPVQDGPVSSSFCHLCFFEGAPGLAIAILTLSTSSAQVPRMRRPRQLLHQHAAAPHCEQQRFPCLSLCSHTRQRTDLLLRPLQVHEILARTVYGRRKRAEVGVDRLVNEGVYSAAFPLHEVWLPAGFTCTSSLLFLLTRVAFVCFLRALLSSRNSQLALMS